MAKQSADNMFQAKVLGHPAGLFVLFFTEMWERFSYYGMRVLLFNFLVFPLVSDRPGWEWAAENAGSLTAAYFGLLYLTPILGGYIADKYIGYRNSVALGALIMTGGHALMALDTVASLYLGLTLMVIGTGFFKPTMTSIISEMYKDVPQKKDGAFTIFYMGVNAGAFFGMMMCGYLAETIGWSWGFGLAGIFMLLGLLQFWFAKPIFEGVGDGKKGELKIDEAIVAAENSKATDLGSDNDVIDDVKEVEQKGKVSADGGKRNPFTLVDKVLIAISATIALIYMLDGPFRVGGIPLVPSFLDIMGVNGEGEPEVIMAGKYVLLLIGLALFLYLVISRISRYDKLVRNRMIAFTIFAFFTVFFWMSFEQGATSLPLFAEEYTNRVLSGGAATAFIIIDILLTFGPLIIITWVLVRLWIATKSKIQLSNIILAFAFLGVWGIAAWKTNRDLSNNTYLVEYAAVQVPVLDDNGKQKVDNGKPVYSYPPVADDYEAQEGDVIIVDTGEVTSLLAFEVNQEVLLMEQSSELIYLDEEANKKVIEQIPKKKKLEEALLAEQVSSGLSGDDITADPESVGHPGFTARIVNLKDDSNKTVPYSWFSILNSFFIIAFASFFSKLWESKYNVPAAFKYGLGLIIMAIGFGCLAYGATGVAEDAQGNVVRVSMIWLILAYLFHTLGELCLSPVGLSYVSKLVPARMIAFMFGMWYLAIAIGNTAAAQLGGMIEVIAEEYSMPVFFLIFTIVPIVAGILIMVLHPLIKKLMGGAE